MAQRARLNPSDEPISILILSGGKNMFKIIDFLIRKPGLSKEEFRAHYENVHRPLAFKTFPQILEHRRNYPEEGGVLFPEGMEQPWDCIVEILLTDRKGFEDMEAFLADPKLSREIIEDGERFLDIPRCGVLIVEEVVARRD
jgi:hypothetical protein